MRIIAYFLLFLFALQPNFSEAQLQQKIKRSRPLTNPAYDLSKNKIHFGFALGLNVMDAEVINKGIVVNDDYGRNVALWADISAPVFGFNVNIISELNISKSFSLRVLPGMSFGQRTFSFYELKSSTRSVDTLYSKMTIESSMIEVPVMLKYSARRHADYRPYLIAGITPRYDLASRKKFADQVYIGLNSLNTYVEFGAGFDFYLPFFKFGTEIKYCRGLGQSLSSRKSEGYEFYPESIKSMISDIIIISFNFE